MPSPKGMSMNPTERKFTASRRGFIVGSVATAATAAAVAAGGRAAPASAAPSSFVKPMALPDPSLQNKFFSFDTGFWNGHIHTNAEVKMGTFTKDARSPLFREGIFEDPYLAWEPRFDNGYPNVVWDPQAKLFRAYYTLFVKDPASLNTPPAERAKVPYVIKGRETGLGYAESPDGVTWTKPSLGIVDFDGSTENNLIYRNVQGTSVILDPADPDPSRRFKLLTLREEGGARLSVAFSADGTHFGDLIPWPDASGSPVPGGDCHNQTFIDPRTGEYVLITRLWDNNVRVSAISRSRDFLNWSVPEEIHRGNGFEDQIYSMPVFEYHGLYLGLASIYHDGDSILENYEDVDLELHWSSNTTAFNKVAPAGSIFIPHGDEGNGYPDGEFDSNVIFAALPLEVDERLWFYYMGGKGQHTGWRETALGGGYIEKDKFAYYGARVDGSESILTTQGLNFSGNKVQLLADIEPGGTIQCELRNTGGTVVQPGFELEKSSVTDAGGGWWNVKWEGASVTSLDPKGFFAMRIVMSKTKLWAVQGDLYPRPLKYTKHSPSVTPSPTPTPTASQSPSTSASSSPSATASASSSESVTPSASATPSATSSPIVTTSATTSATASASASQTMNRPTPSPRPVVRLPNTGAP